MSVLAVVFVCVAGLHLANALLVAMHHARRPRSSEFLPLAGMCFAQAVSAIGTAWITDTTSASESLFGQQLQMAGAAGALAAYSVLAPRVSSAQLGRAPQLVQAWAALFCVVLVLGGCFREEARALRTVGFAWAPDYREAAFTPLGLLLVWLVCPVMLVMMTRVDRGLHVRPTRAETWVAWALSSVAFWNDTLVRFGPLRSIYLTDIAMLVMAMNAAQRLRGQLQASTDELAVRTAELELSTLELEQMHAQLVRRQQLAAVGEFSAVIAHEVRNPLAIIKNAVSALRRNVQTELDPELLSIAEEEVTRLQRLVSDLSTYTRPLVPRSTDVPLDGLLQRVIQRVRGAHEARRSLHVDVTRDVGDHVLYADADLVEMALANVLANAAQATLDGGTITVSARQVLTPVPSLEITIHDTGSGMTPEVVAKAKEPFFTTRSTGTGLGLAIVDRVMRAHDGDFSIASDTQGTRITLRFPLPAVQDTLNARAPSAPRSP